MGDPPHCLVEEDVGAVALELLVDAVVGEDGIEVDVGVVFPMIRQRGDAPGAVVDGLLETAVLRAVRVAVAEVPLAEVTGGVAGGGEEVGHGRQLRAHHRAALADRGAAVAHGVDARHELAARGRAHRGDVEVGEADGSFPERVEVRGLHDGTPVSRDVAIPLVVGDDEDDVRPAGVVRRGRGHGGKDDSQQDDEADHGEVLYRILSGTGLFLPSMALISFFSSSTFSGCFEARLFRSPRSASRS